MLSVSCCFDDSESFTVAVFYAHLGSSIVKRLRIGL